MKDHTAFGLETRPDTSLGRTRFGAGVRATHTQRLRDIDHIIQGKAYFAFSTANDSSHGVTAFASYEEVQEQNGNLNMMVGYRNSSLVVADSVRVGWAVRVGTGFRLGESEDEIEKANSLAAQLPFDVAGLAYERPVVVSAEGRFEMVGCTGGFAHLRLDNATWRGPVGRFQERFDAIATAITIGGYPHPWLGVGLDVGVQWGVTDDPNLPDRITRVGVIFDLAPHKNFSAVAHLAALSGSVEGADVSFRLVTRF